MTVTDSRTDLRPGPAPATEVALTLAVEIVVPVYNEAAGLAASIRRLHAYLERHFPLAWRITIADNASTDDTWNIACDLATELDHVRAYRLERKGRGRALRAVWNASDALVVAYMDVDLSTDLDALLPLVAPLVSGHSDVAIGTRLAPGSRVVRGPKRELISRCYNLILRFAMRTGVSDAQCGFKAVRADVARELLPDVVDDEWFFDTELLLLAERRGLRIHEVPVDWIDDADSRVDIVHTATADLRGLVRVVRASWRRGAEHSTLDEPRRARAEVPVDSLGSQLVRFASVGIVSTLVFGLLFVALAGPFGWYTADVVALLACSVANTAANRRLTFALHGRAGRARHYSSALALSLLPLALTLFVLLALTVAGVGSVVVALVALTAANALAAIARFAGLRHWVFAASSRNA